MKMTAEKIIVTKNIFAFQYGRGGYDRGYDDPYRKPYRY